MLVEITIFNKKRKPLYSFLVDPPDDDGCVWRTDLALILLAELDNHPNGYIGQAKDFKTEETLLTLPAKGLYEEVITMPLRCVMP
jgi:hypothetical protein